MYTPIPQILSKTTIASAKKLIDALRDYSKTKMPHNNQIPLPVSVISKEYNISLAEIEEGSIYAHNKELVQRGTQGQRNGPPYETVMITKPGRDMSEQEIDVMLALKNPDSRGN